MPERLWSGRPFWLQSILPLVGAIALILVVDLHDADLTPTASLEEVVWTSGNLYAMVVCLVSFGRALHLVRWVKGHRSARQNPQERIAAWGMARDGAVRFLLAAVFCVIGLQALTIPPPVLQSTDEASHRSRIALLFLDAVVVWSAFDAQNEQRALLRLERAAWPLVELGEQEGETR